MECVEVHVQCIIIWEHFGGSPIVHLSTWSYSLIAFIIIIAAEVFSRAPLVKRFTSRVVESSTCSQSVDSTEYEYNTLYGHTGTRVLVEL